MLGDRLTPYNVSGLCLCLLGITHYTHVKRNEMRAEAETARAAEGNLTRAPGSPTPAPHMAHPSPESSPPNSAR